MILISFVNPKPCLLDKLYLDLMREAAIMTDDRWYSVYEIAEYLGIRPPTVYKWIERRNMPAHKVGRLWKFKTGEVDHWVKSGESNKKTE